MIFAEGPRLIVTWGQSTSQGVQSHILGLADSRANPYIIALLQDEADDSESTYPHVSQPPSDESTLYPPEISITVAVVWKGALCSLCIPVAVLPSWPASFFVSRLWFRRWTRSGSESSTISMSESLEKGRVFLDIIWASLLVINNGWMLLQKKLIWEEQKNIQ
jgi:hypothetical protein